MILVDTSVLIDYFKGVEAPHTASLDAVIDRAIPYGICDFVYLELLQGARTEREAERLRAYLETLPFYGLRQGRVSIEAAAYLDRKCRKKGVTVRSTIDFLIAQIAIENKLQLLHHDAGFTSLAKTCPDLLLYPAG